MTFPYGVDYSAYQGTTGVDRPDSGTMKRGVCPPINYGALLKHPAVRLHNTNQEICHSPIKKEVRFDMMDILLEQ